ncbi:hypothetical protein BJX70DRAFT_384434 [Aspergillus crustosus]
MYPAKCRPCLRDVQHELNVDRPGYSPRQLLFGPLSELNGRKRSLVAGYAASTVFQYSVGVV